MRIYLSSYRLGSGAAALARDGGRALVVMNALDEYPERLRDWDREADDLATLGYAAEELDLRDHWAASDGVLADRLSTADLVWVVGGNAFVLARAATAAGLGAALATTPRIRYAGYSAGALLAGPDLRGVELMDDPATLPEGYRDGMPVATLALTATRIVPHAGTPEADAMRDRLAADGLEAIELADGDDLLLDSGPALS
jgi:dipeptidase E